MDQASSLRELMNKTQQVKTTPVAVLSTSDFYDVSFFMKQFVISFAQKTQRKTSLIGINEQKVNLIEDCVLNNQDIRKIEEKISYRVSHFPGSLNLLSEMRKDKKLTNLFVQNLKKIEQNSDTLFYYAGEGLDSTAINLSMFSSKVIVLLKPTTKSFMELANYIKIFSKAKRHNQIGIVIDTVNESFFKEHTKKLQELYWKQFKYNIEPIGFIDSRNMVSEEELDIFERFDYEYLVSKKEIKTFSESIEELFL